MSKKKDKDIQTEDKSAEVSHDDGTPVESKDSTDQADLVAELEDKLLRSRAEIENLSRRHLVDLEKAHKYGVERLLLELLPVVDNLEHALKNLSNDVSDSDKEGIELTLKSFESALDKFGISPIYPISEDFDPIQHEAVSVVKDEKHADNKIVEVMQKGWRLHERVIRPARVVVIKN